MPSWRLARCSSAASVALSHLPCLCSLRADSYFALHHGLLTPPPTFSQVRLCRLPHRSIDFGLQRPPPRGTGAPYAAASTTKHALGVLRRPRCVPERFWLGA